MSNNFTQSMVIKAKDLVSTPMRKMVNNMKPLARQMKAIASAGARVGSSLKTIISPIAMIGGVASLAGISSMIKSVSDYGDTVAKTSDRVGMNIESFQKWQYVAEQNGVANQNFLTSLEKLNKNMGELKSGTGSMLAGLSKVSPALVRQLKGAKNNEEAFNLMIKALRSVEDPAKKAYLATLFFGEAGTKMINMANQSEDSLKALSKQAEKLGIVMKEKAARDSEAFGDSISDLKQSIFGIAKVIVSKLMPVLTPLITKLTEFIANNRELIASNINKFLNGMVEVIKNIDFDKVLKSAQSFIKGIGSMIEFVGGAKNAFLILIAIMNSSLIAAVLNLAMSIGGLLKFLPLNAMFSGLGKVLLKFGSFILPLVSKAIISLGTALLTTPIGWFIAGVTAVASAAYLIYKYWGPIKNFFSDLWNGIVKGLKSAFEIAKSIFKSMNETILKYTGIGFLVKGAKTAFSKISNLTKNDDEKPGGISKQRLTPFNSGKGEKEKAEIVVKFDNMPQNAKIDNKFKTSNLDLGVTSGYALPSGLR